MCSEDMALPDFSDVCDTEALLELTGRVDNSLMGSLVSDATARSCELPAPAVEPPKKERPPLFIAQSPARGVSPEQRERAQSERERYQQILDADRQGLRDRAAEDRAEGISTEDTAEDDRRTALETAHDAFQVDLGGVRVQTPYFMNLIGPGDPGTLESYLQKKAPKSDEERARHEADWQRKRGARDGFIADRDEGGQAWENRPERLWYERIFDRDGSLTDARTAVNGLAPTVGKAGMGHTGVGKGSAAEDQSLMNAMLQDRTWEQLPEGSDSRSRFDAKLKAVGGEDGGDVAKVLALAQVAGFGTDCAGYVQHILTDVGLFPDSEMTSANGVTKNAFGSTGQLKQGGRSAKPVDESGKMAIQAGDVLNIAEGGHVGIVMSAVETDTEIIMQLSHSTPTQNIQNGDTQLGTRSEGVRDDIYVYRKDTAPGESPWHTVEGAWSDTGTKSSNNLFEGFYRPGTPKDGR